MDWERPPFTLELQDSLLKNRTVLLRMSLNDMYRAKGEIRAEFELWTTGDLLMDLRVPARLANALIAGPRGFLSQYAVVADVDSVSRVLLGLGVSDAMTEFAYPILSTDETPIVATGRLIAAQPLGLDY